MSDENFVNIQKGADNKWTIRLKLDGDPLQLALYDSIEACFELADGSGNFTMTLVASAAGSIINKLSPNDWGKLEFLLKEADADTLKEVDLETLEVTVNGPTVDKKKFQFPRGYSVVAAIC